jgi:hypothetical protein
MFLSVKYGYSYVYINNHLPSYRNLNAKFSTDFLGSGFSVALLC